MTNTDFQTRWKNPVYHGDTFQNFKSCLTEYKFHLSKHPTDIKECSVGLNVVLELLYENENSIYILATCSIFPKSFLIIDMTFDEYVTCIEAAIGQITLELPNYLPKNNLPVQITVPSLSDNDLSNLKELYKQFITAPLGWTGFLPEEK